MLSTLRNWENEENSIFRLKIKIKKSITHRNSSEDMAFCDNY